ncbi:translocating chain-associated membrane protein 1-like [Lampetra fluviatilis]
MGLRKKSKSPPLFSQDFVIQNHADIMIFVVIAFLFGVMFEATANTAFMFMSIQHNITTQDEDGSGEPSSVYQYGKKDFATIFFYIIVGIVIHGTVQEYILDKLHRRLHLSKMKHSKYNESGQLSFFSLIFSFWGLYIIIVEEYATQLSRLWEGFPHTTMSCYVKFYYIFQLAYWVHALPELYFQKIKKEEISKQLQHISLYIIHIAAAYLLNLTRLGMLLMVLHYMVEFVFHISRIFYFIDENYQKGFRVWAVLFGLSRLITLTLSVLTIGFGLARSENQTLDVAAGNFNTLLIRICLLALICLTQAWMMWTFIKFQLRQWREYKMSISNKKKQATLKLKKDSAYENGIVKITTGPSANGKKRKSS